MAAVSLPISYKKIFLRVIWAKCCETSTLLCDAFLSLARSATESAGSEVVMTGTSANGASVNYSLASNVNFVPALRRAELVNELFELYESVGTNLDAACKKFGTTPEAIADADALLAKYSPAPADRFRADSARVYIMLKAYGSERRSLTLDFGGLKK